VRLLRWFPVALAAFLLVGGGQALADTGKKPTAKEDSSFGALRAVDPAEARKQAEAWLKSVGKTDAGSLAKFKTIWDGDRALLDKVASTLVLGDPQAEKLLAEARDADAAAPTEVPAIIKDAKRPAFFRANLALAYGKALTLRKVYEEALEALSAVKPDEVADPSAYYFHRAVCEYELMLKDRADGSIDRLLVDVTDAPERYRMVAALMHFDMLTWQDKDLGWIARKMDNIQRRLDLKRGGKQTQKMQKDVLVRLEEMIKELENKQKNQGGS
jgi:tetratricopeptide (TPR) repeat protein